MLYVFHVDTGTMMTFDMSLALGSVQLLKESIERTCRIPVEKQVLLVSGGECLEPSARVCSYSAGTDTNPIYFFSKSALENPIPPSPNFDYGSDSDMKEQVDASLLMPVSYNTVVARANLAQKFCELARELTHICEGLVHDQHLQQQGWAAAVANLEDLTADFKSKSEMFQQYYQQHLEGRDDNLKILQSFSKDLDILSKIPILPSLMENALTFSNADGENRLENSENTDIDHFRGKFTVENSEKVSEMTLLMWISAADDQSSLEQMAEQAKRGLEQLDEELLKSLESEVSSALDASNKSGMKEIKGLEERLFGLEQLMVETKKIVQEQSDLAQSLVQNQNRASIVNDASILPDLCASHRRQLFVMWQNQHKLCDIKRRCCKAKEELSINLYHRLGWVMYVENLILNVNNRLMIYHENLKRLRRYVEIIKQVQRAPQVYISAVSEVVRRKNFSQAFLTWASDMSCRLLAVYNEEFEKRREFQSQFEGHFLQSLFPGFEDNPPPFATQAPAPFDVNLPKLTVRDIDQLRECLPEMPMNSSMTKLSTIAQMFLTNTISETKSSDSKENLPVEDRLVAAVSEIGLSSKLDETLLQPTDHEGDKMKIHHPKEDRGFESETDTEEFEKVCQSPVDNGAASESKFEASSKAEVEVLRSHLSTASKLASQTANHLKAELVEMKNNSFSDREKILLLARDIQMHISGITKAYSEEIDNLHKKISEATDSGLEKVAALEQIIKQKEDLLLVVTEDMSKIKSILEDTENEKQGLSETLTSSQQLCQKLQMKLDVALQEKIKAVQAVSDQLTAEYESKIISLEKELLKFKNEKPSEPSEMQPHIKSDNETETAIASSSEASGATEDKKIGELKQSLVNDYNIKLEELKKRMLEEAEIDKQKAVKEVSERLSEEFKREMESLRRRFRLMSAANMEKSPSEASVEKIERLGTIELSNHEAIVSQLKEDFLIQKQKAVLEAVDREREKWKNKFEKELKLDKIKMEEKTQAWLDEAFNKAVTEKNNQVEPQGNFPTESDCTKDIKKIVTDSRVLCKDAGTSPESIFSSGTAIVNKNTPNLQQGKISIMSCSIGDAVIVVWDTEHSNYKILQENSTLYFLDTESLNILGLKPCSDGLPGRLFCTALVTDKEYCFARKAKNRYKVPKGTKFYRVKVRPLIREGKESSFSKHQQQLTSSTQCSDISTTYSSSPRSHSLSQSTDTTDVFSQLSTNDGCDKDKEETKAEIIRATVEQMP